VQCSASAKSQECRWPTAAAAAAAAAAATTCSNSSELLPGLCGTVSSRPDGFARPPTPSLLVHVRAIRCHKSSSNEEPINTLHRTRCEQNQPMQSDPIFHARQTTQWQADSSVFPHRKSEFDPQLRVLRFLNVANLRMRKRSIEAPSSHYTTSSPSPVL